MSVNRYTTESGLQTLANGQRTWIGTKDAYEAAKQAGTLPNDCLIAITDDENDRAVSGTNLLDNPWFTVNQRGQSSYSGLGYTVDRWRGLTNSSTTVNSDNTLTLGNVAASSWIQEYLEPTFSAMLLGKVVTFSVMLSNGDVYSRTDTVPIALPSSSYTEFCRISGIPNAATATELLLHSDGRLIAQIGAAANASLTIRAAKLEIGTASTLENDIVPNYATELLKCQRYFYRMKASPSYGALGIGYGWTFGTTNCRACISLPTKMRAVPTLTLNNKDLFRWTINGSAYTPVTCNVVLSNDMQNITIRETGLSGLTSNMLCIFRGDIGTEPAIIDFSADL